MSKFSDLFSKAFEGRIIKILTQSADKIAEDARRNVNNQRLPKVVAEAIEVGEVESIGNGSYSISITVDLDKAEMAAAYEYGSGERGPEGKPYPIVPDKADALAFLWQYPSPLGRKYILPEDENVVFQKVMHPGVEARPYLQPAIDANKVKIGGLLAPLLKKTFQDVEPRVIFIKSNR
jgi:hypothetical protein